MKTLMTVAALSLAAILPAHADAESSKRYWHNGSLMEVYYGHNGSMIISYLEPKPVLRSIGVRPGTELVSGYWHDGLFHGTAKIFSRCGEMAYRVTSTSNYEGQLILEGRLQSSTPTVASAAGAGLTTVTSSSSTTKVPRETRSRKRKRQRPSQSFASRPARW